MRSRLSSPRRDLLDSGDLSVLSWIKVVVALTVGLNFDDSRPPVQGGGHTGGSDGGWFMGGWAQGRRGDHGVGFAGVFSSIGSGLEPLLRVVCWKSRA